LSTGPGGAALGATTWNESLRVGDDRIDAQHQSFFRMVAEASEAVERGSLDGLGRNLNFLAAYAVMHFRDEEDLMAACAYPGLVEHRKVHRQFVARVAGLLKAHDADPTAVTAQQILPLMHDWLVFHIQGMDKQFQPWVEGMKGR